MNRAGLELRAQLWRRHFTARAVLLGIAAACAVAGALVRNSPVLAIALALGAAALIAIIVRRRAPRVDAAVMAAHLDRVCPSLEESASLWLRDPAALTLVEKLQLHRLDAAWAALPERATIGCPPRRGLQAPIAACVATGLLLALVVASPRRAPSLELGEPSVTRVTPRSPSRPANTNLRAASLTIQPPAYLGQGARRVDGLEAEAPEGAQVTWDIVLDGDPAALGLAAAGSNEILPADALGNGRFRARALVRETRLYQLAITHADGTRTLWPQVHTLKMIPDQPPRLTWQEPAASRTVIEPGGKPTVTVKLAAADDHGVAAAQLIMTVAKGSGEGVKFREQAVALERASEFSTTTALPSEGRIASARTDNVTHSAVENRRSAIFTHTLDLGALGLEAGDELYFHALATDQRTPEPNQARSETRFVVLRGTATDQAGPAPLLAGINRVPQYFRSQRQLIIDTERLLAERATLSEAIFRERSEEIGVDQKLLRLRYGQFLGEEFEPASIGAPREAQGMAFAGRVRGPDRADANRSAAIERAVEAQHAHAPTPEREGQPKTIAELAAPFTHFHDNAEAATLFDLRVKAALRDVLAAMWEAEGFLRTARPAEALPAENRALELLKALQQADRVYVKRVGFEPAPLRVAERRLQGTLEAIPKTAQTLVPPPENRAAIAALRDALAAVSENQLGRLSADTASSIETRLLAAAQAKPEAFVAALEIWRRRGGALNSAERATLRKAVWSLLPDATSTPSRADDSAGALGRRYFEVLTGTAARRP